MAFLELTNITKQFGAATAVQRFDLHIERGEFITFLGPSGCGKTTVLRMVAGFERPTAGTIVLDGSDVTALPANKRNMGMVFQSYALFPNMTVAHNIGFGLKVAGKEGKSIQRRVDDMLEIIKMREFAGRFPHQLSGGQQQRVALARALAISPQALLLDEPLSALDAKIRLSLRQEIRTIQRQLGITTIFVTHDQEEAMSISDRIVVMNKGRIEQVGSPVDIYNSPQTQFVASFIGSLNILEATILDRAKGVIRLDGQTIYLDDPDRLRDVAGDSITMALRPESITPGAAMQQPDMNSLSGTVADIGFLGSVVRIRVQLQEQVINADIFNNPANRLPMVGEAIVLTFSRDACRVLKSDEQAVVA
jgi:putative spermidine/putrescine transport system ATP-binding protein